MKRSVMFIIVASVVLIASCAKKDPSPINTDVITPELTAAMDYYNSNLQEIILNSCASCHSSYSQFEGAANNSGSMLTEVKRGSMPQGSTLTTDEKNAFQTFYDKVLLIP